MPVEELFEDQEIASIEAQLTGLLAQYRRTLQSDRRHLLEQFTLTQLARKVVGRRQRRDARMDPADGRPATTSSPLFLQAKEAQPSVLERVTSKSEYANQGERVVAGQHLMQAVSDIFLGWQRTTGPDGIDRDYYVRQLRDWKGSARRRGAAARRA